MDKRVVPIRFGRRQQSYDITIGSGLLPDAGRWADKLIGGAVGRRLLIVSNRKVFGLYGDHVRESFGAKGFKVSSHLIGDGERFKNLRTLEDIVRAASENGLTRADAIVALGGGVVGDVAGLAASLHFRGIPLLQIPTTLLSMIDSSVGGKTGVNTEFGKNLVGTFYQPAGVLVDIETLTTLPSRELTAGFCEAIKQGAIGGKALFRQIADFLEVCPPNDIRSGHAEPTTSKHLIDLIADQISFKAKIVQNDETESLSDMSERSRKILNFGHTFAHALEKATDYRYLKHGEAVGHGIRFAALLSKKLELVGQDEVDLLNDVVRRAGGLPAISHIDQTKIRESFKHDKKRVGNSLLWVLLKGIGKPVIVPDTEIPAPAITSTLKSIFQK